MLRTARILDDYDGGREEEDDECGIELRDIHREIDKVVDAVQGETIELNPVSEAPVSGFWSRVQTTMKGIWNNLSICLPCNHRRAIVE